MRGRIGLVGLVAALALPGSAQAIVRGTVDRASHPNVGAVTVNGGGSQVLACSGVLVSPTVLVTAAHCTSQLQQLGYTQAQVSFDPNIGNGSDISCGLTDCYVSPTTTYTGTLQTDPQFSGSTKVSATTRNDSHDLGVVTFAQAIPGITPATLPLAGTLDNVAANGTLGSTVFTDVGYGAHAANGGNSGTGLLDGLRRYATSGFSDLSQYDFHLDESAANAFGGACEHDSGGPAFIGTGNVVAGVVSGLDGNFCNSTYYDYRLDTPAARSFLSNYVTVP